MAYHKPQTPAKAVEKTVTYMESKTGIQLEVLPLENYDKKARMNVVSYHPFVKSKIYECHAAKLEKSYLPPYSVLRSEPVPVPGGDKGDLLWQIEIKVHSDVEGREDRILKGTASCSCLKDMKKNNAGYEYDANEDWAEKAETKATGRALAMGGYGNVLGSSLASAEEVAYFKNREKMINGTNYEDSAANAIIDEPEAPAPAPAPAPKKAAAKKPGDFWAGMDGKEIDALHDKDPELESKIKTLDLIKKTCDTLVKSVEDQDAKKDVYAKIKKAVKDFTGLDLLPQNAKELSSLGMKDLDMLLQSINKISK